MTIHIPVTPGELIDRITILEIKAERIQDETALAVIRLQLTELMDIFDRCVAKSQALDLLMNDVRNVNTRLWVAENTIRALDRHELFDAEFIETARSIVKNNNHRHRVKRAIDQLLSFTPEVKVYDQS